MGTQEADGRLMLEFAAQAFQAKNLQLACEIYERQGQAAGAVDWGLLLRRAQCLACTGKLHDAFGLYQEAAAEDELCAEQLDTLVSCLAEEIRRREPPSPERRQWGTVSCAECQGLLYEPVTVPCGHTFCRKCLDGRQCGVCQEEAHHHYRVNVLLSNVISKWFPCQVQAARLTQEGSALYKDNRLEEALDRYTQAITLGNGLLIVCPPSVASLSLISWHETNADSNNGNTGHPSPPAHISALISKNVKDQLQAKKKFCPAGAVPTLHGSTTCFCLGGCRTPI